MVADAEVSWEKDRVAAWNKANPSWPWTAEDIGWDTIFEKILAYEKAQSQLDLGYGWSGFTADLHKIGLVDAPADVIGKDWLGRFASYITTSGADVIDGKLWSVPIQAAVYGIVSRRDWLKAAGISDPFSIRTWNDLLDALTRVDRAQGKKTFGVPLGTARDMAEKTDWVFGANGLDNLADFAPSKKDAYIESIDFLVHMMKHVPDNAFGQDYTGHRQAFTTQAAGFIEIGSYYFGEIYANAKDLMTPDKVVVIPLPGGPHGRGPITQFDLNSYYLMKNSKHKDQAGKLADFLSSPESLKKWSLGIPPLKDWSVDEVVKIRTYGEAERWWLDNQLQISKSVPVIASKGYIAKDQVQEVFYEEMFKVLRGQQTPAAAYQTMSSKIPALITGAGG